MDDRSYLIAIIPLPDGVRNVTNVEGNVPIVD